VREEELLGELQGGFPGRLEHAEAVFHAGSAHGDRRGRAGDRGACGQGGACLARNCRPKKRGLRITVSTSCFIPKPHTPFSGRRGEHQRVYAPRFAAAGKYAGQSGGLTTGTTRTQALWRRRCPAETDAWRRCWRPSGAPEAAWKPGPRALTGSAGTRRRRSWGSTLLLCEPGAGPGRVSAVGPRRYGDRERVSVAEERAGLCLRAHARLPGEVRRLRSLVPAGRRRLRPWIRSDCALRRPGKRPISPTWTSCARCSGR
jgi:hypothetical protein